MPIVRIVLIATAAMLIRIARMLMEVERKCRRH